MSTFHAPKGSPGLKVYDPVSRQSVAFRDGKATTDDDRMIRVLRGIDGVEEEHTKAELVEQAKTLGITGASKLPKEKLEAKVDEAKPDEA